MTNQEKYDKAYMDSFSLQVDSLTDQLEYQAIEEWDSVGHMSLIAELEDAFDIMLETEDIIEFSSYPIGKTILKKYGIEV